MWGSELNDGECASDGTMLQVDGLAEALADSVRHSVVGLFRFDRSDPIPLLMGSGTLVQLGEVRGILTAAHVISKLPDTGELGIVRFRKSPRHPQNYRVELAHVDRIVIWSGDDGSSPDIGFLRLPNKAASELEAYGCVFNNLQKSAEIPTDGDRVFLDAVFGVVGEWATDAPGHRPGT